MAKGLVIFENPVVSGRADFYLGFSALCIFKQTGIAVGMGIASLTMTFVMLATFTADQANHGISFLLTLPITAGQYARQKFALLFGVVTGTIAVITGLSLIYRQLADWTLNASTLIGDTVSIGFGHFLDLRRKFGLSTPTWRRTSASGDVDYWRLGRVIIRRRLCRGEVH